MLKDYVNLFKNLRKEIKLLLFALIFFGLGGAYFSLIFNLYLKELGLREGTIGLILSYRIFGNVLFVLPAAYIVQKYSPRLVFSTSNILYVILQLLLVLFPRRELLLGLSLLTGLSEMLFSIATAPYLMDHSEREERPYIFSMVFGTNLISHAIGSLTGGFFPEFFSKNLSMATSYQLTLFIGIAISIFGLPYLLKLPKQITHQSDNPWKLWKKLRYNLVLKLLPPRLLISFGAGLFIPFLNLYFKTVHNLSSNTIGILFTMAQFSTFFSVLNTPRLIKKIGLVRTVVFTEALSLPFMYLLGTSKAMSLVVPSFLIRQALMNMSGPANQNFTMEVATPQERPAITSIMALSDSIARAFSIRMGGLIIEHWNYSYVFYIAMALYIASITIFYLFFSRYEEDNLTQKQNN